VVEKRLPARVFIDIGISSWLVFVSRLVASSIYFIQMAACAKLSLGVSPLQNRE
jgi:hypothetical protein